MLDAKQVLLMPPPSDDNDEAGAALDESQRTVLARYVVRYGKAFVQAFQAAGSDLERLSAELQPVVALIADGAIHHDPFGPRDDSAGQRIAGEAIAAVIRRLKKRGAAWIFDVNICRAEFRRVIRAIHIRTARESAAIVASRQIEPETEEEEHGD
jgi:hypothetical protein